MRRSSIMPCLSHASHMTCPLTLRTWHAGGGGPVQRPRWASGPACAGACQPGGCTHAGAAGVQAGAGAQAPARPARPTTCACHGGCTQGRWLPMHDYVNAAGGVPGAHESCCGVLGCGRWLGEVGHGFLLAEQPLIDAFQHPLWQLGRCSSSYLWPCGLE